MTFGATHFIMTTMEQLISITRMYCDPMFCNPIVQGDNIEKLKIKNHGVYRTISKIEHIICFNCVYIDLNSWKNVFLRMYIDSYIVIFF
jgi:hypothetical protein